MARVSCPVCDNMGGGVCDRSDEQFGHSVGFDCETCGTFKISLSVLDQEKAAIRDGPLRKIERAALAHHLRRASREDGDPLIVSDWLNSFRSAVRLPSPSVQANNLIRVIGEQIQNTGSNYVLRPSTMAFVGAPDRQELRRLLKELVDRKLVSDVGPTNLKARGGTISSNVYGLTLDGWDRFEREARGELAAGKYGFAALKFGDDVLDPFLEQVIKPGVKNAIGYELVDMRSVSRAGVIDNIMRAQIRDSAFVLIDLTHDNSGAYWEAGYAEGLGKPVIYICEKSKFDLAQTHFDTNHCTTVMWSISEPDAFLAELVATLRRSLNLFPTTQTGSMFDWR